MNEGTIVLVCSIICTVILLLAAMQVIPLGK